MSRRRLLSTRRTVPLDRLDEYLDAWRRLHEAATRAGARAWLFRAATREDQFLEFLEAGQDTRILEDDDVAAARAALDDAFGPAPTEEWESVP